MYYPTTWTKVVDFADKTYYHNSESFPLVLFVVNARTGRMAYLRVMLMDLSCMRIGTKIYVSLVKEKMVGSSYFRYLCLQLLSYIHVYVSVTRFFSKFLIFFSVVHTPSRSRIASHFWRKSWS